MGQLESYDLDEMYVSGLLIGLFSTYFAESHESDSFESYKAYFYSAANVGVRKARKFKKYDYIIRSSLGNFKV
jgi:hypothetical protein